MISPSLMTGGIIDWPGSNSSSTVSERQKRRDLRKSRLSDGESSSGEGSSSQVVGAPLIKTKFLDNNTDESTTDNLGD